MTAPVSRGELTNEDALDRAFDTESADENAERLARDESLREDLEAARAAEGEGLDREAEESHAEYLDPKTVPP